MEELIRNILFIVFSSISIIFFLVAIKISVCPSWKYNGARKKKVSGLAIDIRKNQWTSNDVISEEKICEILR